ncbi:MAG: hypothetical protein FWD83_02010 [Promicromonosporaceae bacterium]|nr:hypothetical protein [Promicromonosporaceae bacterium]
MSDPRDPNEIPLLPEDWPSYPPPLADPVDEQLFLAALPAFPTTADAIRFYLGQSPDGYQSAYRSIQPFPVEYASLLPVSAAELTHRPSLFAWITVAFLGLVALISAALIVANLPGNAADHPAPITGETETWQCLAIDSIRSLRQ